MNSECFYNLIEKIKVIDFFAFIRSENYQLQLHDQK